jgi:hypothetical protein
MAATLSRGSAMKHENRRRDPLTIASTMRVAADASA